MNETTRPKGRPKCKHGNAHRVRRNDGRTYCARCAELSRARRALGSDLTQAPVADSEIALWFADRCSPRDDSRVPAGVLHRDYLAWCRKYGMEPRYPSMSWRWSQAIKSVGLRPYRSTTGRGYRGAELLWTTMTR